MLKLFIAILCLLLIITVGYLLLFRRNQPKKLKRQTKEQITVNQTNTGKIELNSTSLKREQHNYTLGQNINRETKRKVHNNNERLNDDSATQIIYAASISDAVREAERNNHTWHELEKPVHKNNYSNDDYSHNKDSYSTDAHSHYNDNPSTSYNTSTSHSSDSSPSFD